MAAGAASRMRILNTNEYNYGAANVFYPQLTDDALALCPTASKLQRMNFQPVVFDLGMTQANAADAEISIANSVLDGTSTAVLLHVLSSDADDTDNAAKDVRAIHIIGLTCSSATVSNPVYTIEEVRLNGVTGVATTRYYVRVLHAYACAWGSAGADAKGNITVTNVAEAVTYLTIAAGANESDGTAIYVPASHRIIVDNHHAHQITGAAALSGTQHYFKATGLDGEGTDPDNFYQIAHLVSSTYNPAPADVHSERSISSSSSSHAGYLTWRQAQIAGAESFAASARVIAWGTTNTYRGIPS